LSRGKIGRVGPITATPESELTRPTEPPPMLSVLTLAAALTFGAQPPTTISTDTEAADRLESRHLKNIRQVTSGFGRAGEGYFSPDGNAVIFQAAASPEGDYQIYTQDLAPNAEPKLVSTGRGKCTCSAYHPDGKSILFASTHLVPNPAQPAAKKGPAYSRSERYRWDFDPAMDIFRAGLDGSNLVRLTDTPGYDAEGSYSPDGKQIIFTSYRDGDAEIYLMDADGKNPRRITRQKGYDGGPFIAPDGKQIIYRSDRKQNDLLQLYINNLEGTAERALTNNDAVNWGPYFHPDNRHIVYSTSLHGHRNYEVYLMDTVNGLQDRVTYREGFDGLPVFSNDGAKLLWTAKGRNPENTSQLYIADFTLAPAPTASR
jgi:TolB protein